MLQSLSNTLSQRLSQHAIERVRRAIEVLAIVTGISGLTLSDLRQNSPIFFYTALVLLVLLSLLVFFTWKRANYFTDKEEIDQIWQKLLSGSSKSVLIFAGDVSWAQRDENTIRNLTREGVTVSVLCRRPRSNPLLQEHMSKLIHAGARVRYYDESQSPVVRGLVIDGGDPSVSTALTVSKSAKVKIDRQYGVPGSERIYDYRAIRYVPPQDVEQVRILTQLFQKVWKQAIRGFVLQSIALSNEKIEEILSTVPQYAQLQASGIEIKVVDIQSAWAACTIVKDYKIENTLALLDAHETQNVQDFIPCRCLSHVKNSIVLPPILERHGDKLVIIDGMHRLYCQLAFRQKADAICLIISPNAPLPSEPIPFTEVRLWPRKLSRQQSFINFKPQFFRDIELLDNALVDLFETL